MERHTLVRVAGILACLGLCGCLTTEIIGSKTKKRHHVSNITSVHRASIVGSDLVVELDAVRSKASRAERFVIRVPLAQASWPQDTSQSTPLNDSQAGDDVPVKHLPAKLLSGPFDLPDDASAVPIHRVEIGSFDEIPALLDQADAGVSVFAISFKAAEAYHFEEWRVERDPLDRQEWVAITGPDVASAPFVILDFYEGSSRQWAWYLLAPVTLAVDAVTWPIQLIIVLAVPS